MSDIIKHTTNCTLLIIVNGMNDVDIVCLFYGMAARMVLRHSYTAKIKKRTINDKRITTRAL
jgi:hypothetical protein